MTTAVLVTSLSTLLVGIILTLLALYSIWRSRKLDHQRDQMMRVVQAELGQVRQGAMQFSRRQVQFEHKVRDLFYE